MDGVEARGEVVVIGSANAVDSVDSALRRPGRFDRELEFGLPTPEVCNSYEIILVFINLENISLNLSRINQRISEGGHSVPAEKVAARIPRTLENIRKVIPLCDSVFILDNSRADNPFKKLVTISTGKIKKESALPSWCELIISDFL